MDAWIQIVFEQIILNSIETFIMTLTSIYRSIDLSIHQYLYLLLSYQYINK